MRYELLLGWLSVIPCLAQPDTIRLREVTVSATRFDEPARQSPFQIQPISREQIAFRNHQNTADMLAQTGNVFVQKSQGGGGSPVLRGFEASRVLLVVDGVRLNNAIFRSGHLQNALRIDPALLERVEVLFGPGSTLYGSDALGGVIYFQTRNPELSTTDAKRQVRPAGYLRYTSATGERTAHADVSLGSKRWGLLSSVTAATFGDVVQGANRLVAYPDFGKQFQFVESDGGVDRVVTNPDPNRQVGTAYSQLDLAQKVLFQPIQGISHLLNIQYSTTSNVPRYDRLSELEAGKPRFAEWYYGPETRLLAAYRLEISRASRFYDQLGMSVAYQHLRESRHSRRLNAALLKQQAEAVGVVSVNADFKKTLGRHQLQYGLELTSNEVTSKATYLNRQTAAITPADTRYPDEGSTLMTAAIYLTDAMPLTPAIRLTGGVRYSGSLLQATFKDRTFFPFPFATIRQAPSGLSGHLGLIYTPTERSKLSLLGSSGYRAPNVDDLTKVFDSRAGSLVVPNPGIRPEYAYTVELTLNQWLGDWLRFDGTGFITHFDDAIVVDAFSLNGQVVVDYMGVPSRVLAAQNKRQANIRGYSLGTLLKLSRRLSVSGNLNGTAGRILDEKNTPLDHIPPTFGRLSVCFQHSKFQVEGFSLFSGWKRIGGYNPGGEDNPQYATPEGMPGWYTLNLRGSVRLSKVLTGQVALENMLDRNYRTFASGMSAPGRNLMLTLRAGL